MSRKNGLPKLKLPIKDPAKTVREAMTTRTPTQEKVFFSNDNADIEGRIKAFLESTYPRFFDPLNPISFANIEGDLLERVVKIEKDMSEILRPLSVEIIELRDLANLLKGHLLLLKKEFDEMEERNHMLKDVIANHEKLVKLISSSVWKRLKFVFFNE